MSFLKCTPSVFVIGNEYEIIVNTQNNGIVWLEIDGKKYYEENSGVLSSEKNITKIRIPQNVLNETKAYSVVYRETINRKAYYSQMGDPQSVDFVFKPLTKTKDIHIYHVADVHYRFDMAQVACSYFGEDTDLFVVNGDIGEVETIENYEEVCKFVGEISKGEIPVIFVRGNHDTRGKLAEKFTDYFPANGKDTYFSFEIGCLNGVALDCGEDKIDEHKEYGAMEYFKADKPEVYGGVNVFSAFRQRQLAYLQSLKKDESKLTFAISHICPVMTTQTKGNSFDIERECYQAWNDNLERIGIKFMLCGHLHKAFILPSGDERSTLEHNYPVVVGSAVLGRENIYGAAITLNPNVMEVAFTDKDKVVVESYTLNI